MNVRYIIIHCSASRCNVDYSEAQMLQDHLKQGFRTIGYHYYIRKNGSVSQHREHDEQGAHCRGYNDCSIGVCYEGGLDEKGSVTDTRTDEQKKSLKIVVRFLHRLYPSAIILGHCDLNPQKNCPCFNVSVWLSSIDLGD